MKEFNFYQDHKVTIWERVHFKVKAPNYEQAVNLLKGIKDRQVSECEDETIDISEGEMLFETSEDMTVEQNGGCATLEYFTEDGIEITNNLEL